jgi:L-lysine exporter family protein LysE/ArgO
MDTFIYGFFLGLSLILAIGSQNAFVLKQGLKGEHLLMVCLICAFSDAVLILIGVSGFHVLVSHYPEIVSIARYGGATFLFIYGLRSFYNAWSASSTLNPSDIASSSWIKSALTCLAFTWLNPHVYLDTVVLLGSISAQFAYELVYFSSGAITASFTFFIALGYGAKLLRPVFARARSWQILEILIGCIMWAIAAKILFMQ